MYVLRGERTRNRLEICGTAVPKCCRSEMGEKGVAWSCLEARSDRANLLSTGVKKSDFCGLCLGWKLGQEGSLSSDTKMMYVAYGSGK